MIVYYFLIWWFTVSSQDMYCALESAGFKHSQIEKAMLHTVPVGGNLISALDWLCLNTPDGEKWIHFLLFLLSTCRFHIIE